MILSSGTLRTFDGPDRITWTGNTANIPDWVSNAFGSYETIYERQPWVATLVDKISVSLARLPFKTYVNEGDGRPGALGAYADLMNRPCPAMSLYDFWRWTVSTLNIHGEAVWVKVRDNGGRPIAVYPRHPSRIAYDGEKSQWFLIDAFGQPSAPIARRDFVFFRMYNPRSLTRGLSPLEPLRAALENEEGAQRANSAMWRNGARPSVWLEHPKTLNDGVTKRLAATWAATHGGVDNWSKAAVLEEGMVARVLPINYEELAYIESRKLNRDECCSRFDIPPPVVHILDHATFSNITEQMRSMYRDSMGWRVKQIEQTIDSELRDGSFGEGEPDFSPQFYGEFLMDEVLRGAFEARQAALAQADYMTIAEKRRLENLPFIEGTDQIFMNSATLPLGSDGHLQLPAPVDLGDSPSELALVLQKLYLAVGKVITSDEARAIANRAGAGLVGSPDFGPSNSSKRSLMGRLGRVESIDETDLERLTDGLDAATLVALESVLSSTDATDMVTLRGEVAAALTRTEASNA